MPLRTAPVPFAKDRHTRHGADEPCYLCGRETKDAAWWVHPINGGHQLLHKDDETAYVSDGGDLGWHPVGSSCASRIPIGFARTFPKD